MRARLIICLLWILATGAGALAQGTGWTKVSEGAFFEARDQFTAALQADSTDREALLGQLFLYDIWNHEIDLRWLARRLLISHPEPVIQQSFRSIMAHYAEADQPLPGGTDPRAQLYTELWRTRSKAQPARYADWQAALSPLLPLRDWEFAGPFRNVGGSGFIEAYGPEVAPAALGPAEFDNGMGLPVGWVRPAYRHPVRVSVRDHLPEYLISDVYYARHAFSVPADTVLELRLAHSVPVRLWLDGQLVLDAPLPRAFVPDDARIRVHLGAGSHVLLLKLAPLPEQVREVETFSLRETEAFYDRGESLDFILRLTDAAGRAASVGPATAGPAGALHGHARLPDPELSLLQARLGAEATFAWSDYYLLARLYHHKGLYEEGEQYFRMAAQARPQALLLRILLATFYARTGNRVLAFQTLRNLDLDQSPVFGLLYERLEELNARLEPARFKAGLDALQAIAPSNRQVISGYIAYYNNKRDAQGMSAYEARVLETYPAYEGLFKRLDRTRNRDEGKQKGRRSRTPSDRKRMKALEKDLLRAPYDHNLYYRKANMLFRQKKYPATHATITAGLAVAPRYTDLLELQGDLYREEGRADSALHYYALAKRYQTGYRFRGGDLETKMKEFLPPHTARDLLGDITLDEVMASASEWEDRYAAEDALILYWTKGCLVDTAYNLECKTRLAIRIQTPQGVDNWAEENYGYLGRQVSLTVQKADGSVYQPEMSGAYGVIRNLTPGDIILGEGTRTYNLLEADPEYGADLIQEHWFSFINPVRYSRYELVTPQDMPIFAGGQNLQVEPLVTDTGRYRYRRWELYDLPRLQPEQSSPNRWDMGVMLQLSNQPDWSAFVNWYDQLTYRKLAPHYLLQEILDTLLRPGMTPAEQVDAIYRHITQEIRYSSVSFLQSNFIPQTAPLTCTTGQGDCKDVATLMIAMLRMLGIDAWYTLVLAKDYLPYQPQPHMIFNHAIVAYALEGETHFVDLTTDRYPQNVLPEMDAQAWALIIRPGEKDLIRLPDDRLDPTKNRVHYELEAWLDTSLDLRLRVQGVYPGVEGGRFREFLNSTEREQAGLYLQRELAIPALPYRELDSLRIAQAEAISQPLQMTAHFSAQDVGESLYGLLLVELPLVAERSLPDALVSTDPRYSHLDLAQLTSLAPMAQHLTLHFPPGYTLYRCPDDVQLDTPYGTYTLRFRPVVGGLVVEKYRAFTQAVLPPTDFAAFKAFFRSMLKHDKTRLVLVEKESTR